MVGAGPEIGEDERPESDDGKAVAEDGEPRRFGKKIVEIQDIASHFSREKFVDGIRKNLEEIGSKNRTISVEVI